MKHFLFFIFLLFWIQSKGQGTLILKDKPFVYNKAVDSSLWNELARNELFGSLSVVEQKGFYWTNYFRKAPRRFFDEVIREFVRQFPEANTVEVKELGNEVSKLNKILPVLYPDKGLLSLSAAHSADLIKRGSIISHKSSSGKDFGQRMNEAGLYRCGGENIYVGTSDPLEALITLLLDHGVPDRGHRKNLLDPRFGKMGLSFPSVSENHGLLVQDFACL